PRLADGRERVVGDRIPRAEDEIVERGERDEILDEGRALVGALAEADGGELRDRTYRLGETASHTLGTGHKRGGHGAEAGREHTEATLGWCWRTRSRSRPITGRAGTLHEVILLSRWSAAVRSRWPIRPWRIPHSPCAW